ncbi:hypothetical protein BGZ68_003056, partial [Mortierella alpina]
YGYHILWLPPYHPDINPIEEAWGVTKGYVSQVKDASDFGRVKDYIYEGFEKADGIWKDLVRRAQANELRDIMRDRIATNEIEGDALEFYTDSESDDDSEDGSEDSSDEDRDE